MSIRTSSNAWDLSPVLELVNALSLTNNSDDQEQPSPARNPSSTNTAQGDRRKEVHQHKSNGEGGGGGVGLGDFASIWQFLGVSPADSLTQKQKLAGGKSKEQSFIRKGDYASDGAVRYGVRSREQKKVTWRDDTSVDDAAPSSSPDRGAASETGATKLTKSQRKKKARRERKAKDAAPNVWTVSESEADTVYHQTPARKAGLHSTTHKPTHHHDLRARHADGRAIVSNDTTLVPGSPRIEVARIDQTMRQASQPDSSAAKSELQAARHLAKPADTARWPVTPRSKVAAGAFLPSSVAPRSTPKSPHNSPNAMFPHQTNEAVKAVQMARVQLQASTPTSAQTLPQRPAIIAPKTVRSGEDRHWALLLKLINEFGHNRKHLVSPMNMTTHNNDPTGIHLFVDASNIFIGFNDQLKLSRNIPLNVQVPPVNLSFDALALLMERRRPIAKRTLVGSTPYLPAFDKAKAVGYECSILEKVYKARELTDRQVYFKDRGSRESRAKARGAAAPSTNSHDAGYSSGGDYGSSDTGTVAKQFAPARMIEQGVDELLHMKMAQSLLDYDTPSTMVVATGDAAQAEYSDGFKAMIERALRKHWTVELVSWSKNISSSYLRRDFRSAWGDQFKIIYLDDYAEELLDM